MSEQLKQLQDLQTQLHEVNLDFARAAQPLDRLSEMNLKQREQLADQLRAVWARWEAVTQQISQVLQSNSAGGV
jgi:flagellar biosynthesis chaperone FliJ